MQIVRQILSHLTREQLEDIIVQSATGPAVYVPTNSSGPVGIVLSPARAKAGDSVTITTVKPRKAKAVSAAPKAPAATPAKAKPAKAPKVKAAKAGKTGTKRDPEKLAALTDELLKHIKANPGQRIEQIGKAMGETTKSLALPAKKLVKDGFVKTIGVRRATAYLPVGGKTKSANGVAVAAE